MPASTMKRINHQLAYSALDGACTNDAEEFFSRMRRAEIGHHHHIAGAYLVRYAQESAWREDHRREPTAIRSSRSSAWRWQQAERGLLRVLAAVETSSGGIGAGRSIADMAGQSDSVDFRDVIDAGPSGVTPSTLDLIQSLPTPVLMSLIARLPTERAKTCRSF